MHSARNLWLRSLLLGTFALLGACAVRSDAAPTAPNHDHATVTLQRSSCYGNCPAYTVTLKPDGTVDFVGHLHVKTDHASGHVAAARRANIFSALEQARFRDMHDSYVSRDDGCSQVMTDQPGIKITLSDEHGSKSVNFYLGCEGVAADAVRERIITLAKQIDTQLDTARWIGTPAAPGAIEHAVR